MNKRSGNISEFAMMLLLLLIGGALIYGSLFDPAVGDKITSALEKPIIATTMGAILILAVAFRWVGRLRKPKSTFIDYQSEDGNVGISTKAIKDFIERVGNEFAAVKSIDTKLIQNKGSLDVLVGVHVRSGNKIPELSQVLQQRIRESVRESLGLDEIGKITVQIRGIIGEPEKPAEPEEQHITG